MNISILEQNNAENFNVLDLEFVRLAIGQTKHDIGAEIVLTAIKLMKSDTTLTLQESFNLSHKYWTSK